MPMCFIMMLYQLFYSYTRHHCEGPCPCKGGKRGRKRKDSNQQNNKMGRSRRVNSKNLKTKNIPNESSKMSGTNQQSAPLIRTGKGQVKRQNKEIRRRPKSSQSYILPETTGKGVSGRGKPSLGKAKQNSIKASVPIQRSNPNLVNNNQPPVQPRPVIKGGRVATSYFENIGQLKIVNNKKSQPYIISNTGPSNEYAPVILKYRNNGIRGQAQSNTYRQSQQSGRSGNKQNTDTSKTIPKISISNTPARDAQYRAQYKIVRNIPQSGRTKTITGQRVNAGATSTTQKRMNTPVGGIQQGTLFNPGRNDQQQGSIRAKTDQPSNAGPSNNYLKKVKPNSPARDIIAIFDMTDVQGGPPPSQPVAKQTLIKEIQSGVSKFNARTGAASFTKTIKQGDKKTGLQSRGFNIKQATRSNVRQLPTIKESGTRLKSMKGLPVNLNLGKPITIKAKNLKTKPSGEKRRPKPAGGKRRPKPAGGKRRPKTNTIESRKQNVVSKSGNITQGRQQTRARNTGKDGLSEKQRQGKMLKTTAKPKRTSIGSDAGRRRPRNKKPACVCPGAIKQVCGKDGKTYKNACKMKCS